MKYFLLLACVSAITIVILPNTGNCFSLFSPEEKRSPFIAMVRFTIRNLTSNWIIPGPSGCTKAKQNSDPTRTTTTTVRLVPRPVAIAAAPAKPKSRTANSKTTTTTTTPPPPPPFINIVESIVEIECSPAACESEDVQVLEKCDEFCIHLGMNASGSATNSHPHDTAAAVAASGGGNSAESTSIPPPSCSDYASKCTCHYDLAPVCGSDGKTYANFCELDCAQKCSPELTLVHNGGCEKRRKEIRN